MYTGHQAAAAPVPEVAMARDVIGQEVAKGMQQVGANLDGMLLRGIAMEDAKNEFEAERELMSINSDTQAEVERMLNTPDGKDGSLFDEHGQIRQEKVMNVRDKVQARLAKVGQNIIDPERKEKLVRRAMLEGDKILDDLGQTWEKVTRRKTETAWKDTYDLAVAKGEYGEAAGLADRGVELGLFSKERAEVMKLQLKATEERARLARQRMAERNDKVAADEVSFELLDGMKEGAPADTPAAGEEKQDAAVPDDGYKAHYVKDPKNYVPVLAVGASDSPVADMANEVRSGKAAVDPVADDKLETLELGLNVEKAASITLGDGGSIAVTLAESPSDVSVWQAARATQGGYTLNEHRLDVAHVAAAVLSDENYAGLTDKQRRDMIVQRVHLVGGAQLFFDGDDAAYEGWIMNQAEQLSGLKGVVKKTDRMLAGYGGAKGINALLNDEVTEQEVRDVWEGDRLLKDETAEGIKAREALYLKYRDEWAAATGEEPRKDIIAAGDLSDFMEWYQQKGGKHDQRRASFVKGVRDVYRQKAMDAVLRLRAERVAKLSDGTVVELDGKSDWAVEQRVIRDTLGVPLTRADYGTLEALAHQEAVMADARRQRARGYAAKARESQEKVAGFNEAERKAGAAALAAEPAVPALDATADADAEMRAKAYQMKEAAAKKVEKQLLKQLGQGLPVNAKWDGKKGAGAPKVVMPAALYKSIAGSLDAKDGFFVVLPGSGEPVPVEPDKDAAGVVFNKACISMLKKGKFSKAELGKVVNGAAIKMKFTKDSVRYDF